MKRKTRSEIGREEVGGCGTGGAPVKRERSGICKISLTGRRNTKYGGRKIPFLRRRKKQVGEKVAHFVKLIGHRMHT